MGIFTVFLVASLISSSLVWFYKKDVNLTLMRFFRDLSRYKARKRLYGNEASLVAILTKKEEPLEINYEILKNGDGFTMTPLELSLMDGRTLETPIYISVKGHIYDVSTARDMYGPEANYRLLVGRDSSLAFSAGCCEVECIGSYSEIWYSNRPIEGLDEGQISEIDTWVELYHTHDRYKYIGELVPDLIDEIIKIDEMSQEYK